MKTGTVYATHTSGTASGPIHVRREIGYVGNERTYLGKGTGEYVVSTVSTWGVALLVNNGPDGWDAWDAVDDMSARRIVKGAASGRDALGLVPGVRSFRVDRD